ncbi:hypothetical protein [Priestia aryabhattai]
MSKQNSQKENEMKNFLSGVAEKVKGLSEKEKVETLGTLLYQAYESKNEIELDKKELSSKVEKLNENLKNEKSLKESTQNELDKLKVIKGRLSSALEQVQNQNISLKNQLQQKSVDKGTRAAHRASKKKVKLSTKIFSKAKEKYTKSRLNKKKKYLEKNQEVRAVLRTANNLTLKPAMKFTMKEFKNRKKTYQVIQTKVDHEMTKQTLDRRRAVDYGTKFATVAAGMAAKKVGKKVFDTSLKDAWNKVTTMYKDSIASDNAKIASIDKQLGVNQGAKPEATRAVKQEANQATKQEVTKIETQPKKQEVAMKNTINSPALAR